MKKDDVASLGDAATWPFEGLSICPGADDGNSYFPPSSRDKGSTFLLLPDSFPLVHNPSQQLKASFRLVEEFPTDLQLSFFLLFLFPSNSCFIKLLI